MRTLFQITAVSVMLAMACSNPEAKVNASEAADTAATLKKEAPKPVTQQTDTLQFLHFDGNGDYWYAVFINKRKDTVKLVTDDTLDDKLLGKLLKVKWQADTLFEAGDNDRRYTAKRLMSFQEIKGKPFVLPLTENAALEAVKQLEVVKSNADKVWVSEKPTADKRYYQVETATVEEGHNSRFQTFRVYFYPKYEIRIWTPEDDKDISLDEWQKRN